LPLFTVLLVTMSVLQLEATDTGAGSATGGVGGASTSSPPSSHNVTLLLGANNVQGQVSLPTVHLLGIVANVSQCEDLCYATNMHSASDHGQANSHSLTTDVVDNAVRAGSGGGALCLSFTYHHLDFVKPEYRGHCYEHTDAAWAPVSQSGESINQKCGCMPESMASC
jgi:hypothetical protein